MKVTQTNAEAAPRQPRKSDTPPAAPRPIELLAPAKDAETARQAILHGADAIYIGASGFGARKSAANSVEDIADIVKFAHQFRVKVYVTVNTIVYNNELTAVEHLCRQLYEAGVDALIVQDMALLEMNLPPIELHASTQCDTRTPVKAKFLEEIGFSQIVLARELTLKEIGEICATVSVPVECFVHGALCVSYSGRCHASQATCGRSANRGECAQLCRLPYTLTDANGKILAKDRYLLSLKDFNASANIEDMLEAGVSSFKIEGRLKDVGYVKNITAYYRQLIDKVIENQPDKYCRASVGESRISFEPNPEKSFNRGFTTYFQNDRKPANIASLYTPKSLGEQVEAKQLNAGDGISWLDKNGDYTGALVNGVNPDGSIKTQNGLLRLPKGIELRRTSNRLWDRQLAKPTAERKIGVDMEIDAKGLTIKDRRGLFVRVSLDCNLEEAKKPFDPKPILSKLGNTIYRLDKLTNNLTDNVFIPASELTSLRRSAIEALDKANESSYPLKLRKKENPQAVYPDENLIFSDNVANRLTEAFYKRHGVRNIEPAMEVSKNSPSGGNKTDRVVMTTRHCILRELGMCLKDKSVHHPQFPLTMIGGKNRFTIKTDCKRCEMQVIH